MGVKFDRVNYIYNKRTIMAKEAINDVTFEIKDGDFVAILGKTGSGKSTLLSLIDGIEKPESGTISVSSEISMLFQSPENQLFAQTVLEDVMYGPLNIGLNEKDARDSAITALKLVGIEEALYDKDPTRLSGGQKRKVALAGVLAMNRPLLLLDEPTSGLDNKSAQDIMNTLQNLNKQGITIIVSTHESEIARQFAKRVLILKEGCLVYNGKPKNIYSYGFEAPEINEIAQILYKNGVINDDNFFTAQALYNVIKK